MSPYYDLIMQSGYYDYDKIATALSTHDEARSTVLEIGVGTGLILEELAARSPELTITGIDLTPAMLDIAAKRLESFPQITLRLSDVVTMELPESFRLAFSYGGVWYFVPSEVPGQFTMISHIRDEQANRQGLERVAEHLASGGTLLLGIQSPHVDYVRPVGDRYQYAQQMVPIDDGFRKRYSLTEDGITVMEQATDYRIYPFEQALELLDKCGLEYRPATDVQGPLFLEFIKR
jgi:hypothetical protein